VRRALRKLHRLEAAHRCDVLYTDESGFGLQPPVPYLWQKKGQTLGLPSQAHSRRLNVLGFFKSDGSLWHFATQQRLTAQHFVESVEALLPQLNRPVVLVLDNASIHRCRLVREKRAQWKKRGLRLLFLPPYCPHLNRIERLWRQVKYVWLDPQAYQDFATLCRSVQAVLNRVGGEYRLSFA